MTTWASPWYPLLVVGAGFVAGAVNSVAGGGTNISFPALILVGLPPVQANATNAVALWPGTAGGAWGYRREIRGRHPRWFVLLIPSLVGGAAGAYLLLHLPPSFFASVAPYLVIGSSALVALEPALSRRLGSSGAAHGGTVWLVAAITAQLLISLYGGYFGAGTGMLLLVVLGLLGMTDLQQANGLKNLLTLGMKGAAVVYFILVGALVWYAAALMAVGATVGGFAGAEVARRFDPGRLRWIVVALGVAIGIAMILTGAVR